MYANLKVTIVDTGETLLAWRVEHDAEDGATLVHVDANDGTSSYAEPAGTRRIEPGVPFQVDADF